MEAKKLTGSEPESFQFSLRIRHPSIDPAELSEALNVEPEYAFAAGSPRRASKVSPASVYSETYWLGVLKVQPAALADLAFSSDDFSRIAHRHVAAVSRNLSWSLALIVGRVLHGHADLLRRIRAEGGEATVLVTVDGAAVSTFSMTPETSRVLSDLGLTIEFELGSE